jgi:tRNA1Val (adenine37-N6)-methyltransferase
MDKFPWAFLVFGWLIIFKFMPNQNFHFKQFSILQDKTAMKIGTDGILLGAWADCGDANSILDIGAGTGILAIMMAQKSNAEIYAVEIDEDSYNQAYVNVNNCKWKDRIHLFHSSFQDFIANSKIKFDFIISNPPYFINSLKTNSKSRNLARHNDLLSFHDLISGVNLLLSKNGRFSLILPIECSEQFLLLSKQNHLFCHRKTLVKPNLFKEAKRVLLELGRNQVETKINTLTIETDKRHHYTNDYKKLTEDFYLYFNF